MAAVSASETQDPKAPKTQLQGPETAPNNGAEPVLVEPQPGAEIANDIGQPLAERSPAPESAKGVEAGPLPIYGFQFRRDGKVLLQYLLDSEVHTFAFSVAANAILSFIPFIVLLYAIAHSIFHSAEMTEVIGDFIKYLFPSNQDWVVTNISLIIPHRGVPILSLVMILISCTGIFLPLEVALNRSWGVAKSRNYLMNQLLALGLAVWMVVLGMLSILLNAGEHAILYAMFFGHIDNDAYRFLSFSWLAISAAIASILFFFSIYWVLPNRKLPPQPVLRVSIVTGLLWVGAKYLFVALLPLLDLRALYGPFSVSVGLLLWAYVSGLLLFAGAQFSAMRYRSRYSEDGRVQPLAKPAQAMRPDGSNSFLGQ